MWGPLSKDAQERVTARAAQGAEWSHGDPMALFSAAIGGYRQRLGHPLVRATLPWGMIRSLRHVLGCAIVALALAACGLNPLPPDPGRHNSPDNPPGSTGVGGTPTTSMGSGGTASGLAPSGRNGSTAGASSVAQSSDSGNNKFEPGTEEAGGASATTGGPEAVGATGEDAYSGAGAAGAAPGSGGAFAGTADSEMGGFPGNEGSSGSAGHVPTGAAGTAPMGSAGTAGALDPSDETGNGTAERSRRREQVGG
jgi:hypothetical protein